MTHRYYQWLLVFPALPILLAWDKFIVTAGTNTSDILISHFPNLLLIQRSIAAGEGVPLWSPLILSGYPFAANPLSSLWYPPAWISLLFPLSLGINIVMAVHIILGCVGFFYLLRRLGLSEGVALFGGLSFGFLPAGYAHVVAGHFTWVCASAWFPWLLVVSTNWSGKLWNMLVLQGLFLGLMMLADLRFSVYAGIIWAVYVIYYVCINRNELDIFRRIHHASMIIGSGLLALGLSAAMWFPLLEYVQLSTRSLMTAKDSLYLSLPPVQLTGLVIPGHPSTVEWILYPGAFCFLLAFLSITFFRKNRDLWFWSLVALLCLLWALGENVAWNKTLITLPVLNLLRVPARGVYFLSVAFLMMSVTCLDRLLRSNPEKAVFLRLGSIGVAVLVLLVQGFVAFSNTDKNLFIVYHMVCWAVMTVLILLYSYRKISMISFVITLGIVGILDIGYVDFRLINTRTSQNAFTDGGDFGDALIEKGNDFRSFSASYSISQQTAAFRDLELSDGIDPMQLISYSNFIRESTGSSVDGYSVTLPEFRNGKPELDNFGVKPSALKFSLLNVRYLVSAFPIDEEGWVEEEFQESGFLYRNDLARGWAWIEPSLGSGVKDYDSVSQVVRTNNQIRVLAEGPGFLHISEIDYPGWQATVDGKPARIHKAYGVIRAVEVEEGLHNVTMIFRPVRVFYGVLISLMTVGLGLVMLEKNKHRWLISAVLVIFVVTSIPYLMGYFFQETDWRFTGFLFGVEDGNSYIAKMLSGTFGNWLFRSPYSTLSQSGVLAFFPYILLGKLASPPALHDQLVVLFQIFRFFASGLLIWATYSFVSLFIISPAYKKLATLVILIGGGLGWLGWVFIPDDGSWRLPLEVYSPEAFGFLSIVGLPHLAAARALLLLGFTGFIKQINTGFRFSSMWKSGMFWLAAGFFQPLTLAVGCAILTVTVLFIYLFSDLHRENQGLSLIKSALFMGVAASPWIVYNLFFFSSDAYLLAWYKQNIINSPPLYDYLWSFGVYLMAAGPALLKIFKEKVQNAMILPAWVICAAILAYVPYNLQRRFIEGVWVAIVVLIFLSLEMIKDRRWHIGYSSLIATTCIAPLLVFMTLLQGVMNIDLPVYRPNSEVKMFEYLAKVAEPGDTVLCSYETGNALPAWAPVFVLAGHGPESANLEAVIIDIEKFYSRESTKEWRDEFIFSNSVDFVILGPEEKKSVPSSFVLEDVFQPIYDDQNYQVFKVVSGWNE